MRGLLLLLTLALLPGCNLVNINPGAFDHLSSGSALPPESDDKWVSPLHPVIPRGGGEDAVKTDYDWVFFYYMAYDNNLEGCGRPILNMLREGITSERVAVVTIADFRDKEGCRRYEQTKAEEKETALKTEASAEVSTLQEQLRWTSEHYEAGKYAVVFLDHGSRLSEMSYDENPDKKDGPKWLAVNDVAPVLSDWRKGLEGSLELVFIQQCGKGALENYYSFRNVAPFVMASQTVIGAPNYYYTEAIKAICDKPDVDGKELSHLFQQHETDTMFTTYTTLNEKALDELPKKLDAVLKPLLAVKELNQPSILREYARRGEKLPDGTNCRACFEPAKDETMVDGLIFLKALFEANELEMKASDEFATWVKETLVTEHRVSPKQKAHAGDWCGFSLCIPRSKDALKRYEDYPIYKDTNLKELMAKLAG